MNSRQTALKIFESVVKEGAYLNLALKNEIPKDTSPENRRFITALVSTAIENLERIDYILKPYITGKRVHSIIKNILRLGACQILFFESVPVSAAVNESVKLAELNKKRQLKGFVNAVLRKVGDNIGAVNYPDPHTNFAEYLHIMYSVPLWLCKKYIEEYGRERAQSILSYKSNNALTCVRRNYFVGGKLNIDAEPGLYSEDAFYIKNAVDIANMDEFNSGLITVQGEASMLCVTAAGIKENDSVLDMCAAPGGKSAYAAWLAKNGSVTALDLHRHRVEMIEATKKRLHIPNMIAEQSDATELNDKYINKFDVVLADAPCSALGLMYRKPDIKLFKTPEDIESIISVQRQILNNGARYVKPGGILMYSTCTINKNENQDNIELFLEENPDFKLRGFEELMPEKLKERAREGMLQLYPDTDGIDGFFMAKLQKENERIVR